MEPAPPGGDLHLRRPPQVTAVANRSQLDTVTRTLRSTARPKMHLGCNVKSSLKNLSCEKIKLMEIDRSLFSLAWSPMTLARLEELPRLDSYPGQVKSIENLVKTKAWCTCISIFGGKKIYLVSGNYTRKHKMASSRILLKVSGWTWSKLNHRVAPHRGECFRG